MVRYALRMSCGADSLITPLGSYKQYIVSPERYTSLIPDGVPDEIAGPIMCSEALHTRPSKNLAFDLVNGLSSQVVAVV
jgi:D-arabinose 1-dehydrogenase-like Zn-dependent alcohol dehydrogenase